MSNLLDRLSETRWIVISFIAMLLIGFGFGVVGELVGGQLLDEIADGGEAEAVLAQMTDEQRSAHFWVTALLDSAYPVAYGAFFIGLLARFGRSFRRWTILPAVVCVVTDVIENTVQMLALSGTEGIILWKSVLTPLKFGSLLIAVLLAFGLGIYRWLQRLKAQPDTGSTT